MPEIIMQTMEHDCFFIIEEKQNPKYLFEDEYDREFQPVLEVGFTVSADGQIAIFHSEENENPFIDDEMYTTALINEACIACAGFDHVGKHHYGIFRTAKDKPEYCVYWGTELKPEELMFDGDHKRCESESH